MKFFSVKSFVRSRYPFALAAGLLLASAFPKIGVAGLAWIAPGLMIAAALGKDGAESFRIGYAAGLAHYLASLYWLLLIPVTGFPILGWAALGAYLALFPALWIWAVARISAWDAGPGLPSRPGENWLGAIRVVAEWSWSRRMVWALSCASLWVAMEMIVTRLFTGFPWNLLGVSQYRILPLIQIASVVGVPGLSFLIVWTSAALLAATAVIIIRPQTRSVWMAEIILPMAALAGVFAFGFHRLNQPPPEVRELKIALVQPSIPQTLIWNSENDQQRFRELIALSEKALAQPADVLIWPEAALPRLLRYDEETLNAVTGLAAKYRVWMIIGSDDAEASNSSKDPQDADYYNASFLISPQGKLADRYCKRQLVIFGEYIPLMRWMPFLKWFTPIQGGFTPGRKAGAFKLALGADPVVVSPLICFEDSFPHLVRQSVGPETDFLVNLTNDGWFGRGAAQWQHAATGLFRAVENGLPLVRCTNTGLTCWFDENGRWRAFLTDPVNGIYGPGFLTLRLPLPAAADKPAATFYRRHGDLLGWSCVAFAVLRMLRRRKRNAL